MTHVPSGQPPTDIAAAGSFTVNQEPAIVTAGTTTYSIVAKNIDLNVAANTIYTIYTTEANRGRFVAVAVQTVIQEGFTPSVGPQLAIGFIGPSYDQIMTTKTLTTVSLAPTRCAGLYENVATVFVDTTTTSVPASTAIIARVVSGAAATAYKISIGIIGFYTG